MSKIRLNVSALVWLQRAEDFVATYSFPKDLLEDVVRDPDSVGIDPSSEGRDYKVLRFRRGDITVVVGLRDPDAPSVIHVWLHYPEEDFTVPMGKISKPGSGGGERVPTNERQLKGYLMGQGCSLKPAGSGHIAVFWGETRIGTIPSTGHTNGEAIKGYYSTLRKRLFSLRAQESLRKKES